MRRTRTRRRGMTLVELMITVVMVGVLASLGAVGYSHWIRASKTAEATAMIAAFKGAQETYRAEALRYLSIPGFFPLSAPTDTKAAWDLTGGDPTTVNIRRLGVHADSAVYYRYSSPAGNVGDAIPTLCNRNYPAATEPWFQVIARGDLNGNGVESRYCSSSMDANVWSVLGEE